MRSAALFGVTESCTPDCLYFEQGGKPTVGCLFKNTSADTPRSIARQLLKSAGRPHAQRPPAFRSFGGEVRGCARRSSYNQANASRKLAGDGVSVAPVLFRQFVDDDLGCASYLIGDPRAARRSSSTRAYAIEQYLEAAERRVRIVRVLETHTHADHVSGHGRFALEHEVPGLDPLARGARVPARRARRRRRSCVSARSVRVLSTRRATGRSIARSSSTDGSC